MAKAQKLRDQELETLNLAKASIEKEKAELDELLKTNAIKVEPKGYDAVYVYAMASADFKGSSLADEAHILKYVGDYLGDVDGYEGIAFTRFYADCIAKGIPVQWDDML